MGHTWAGCRASFLFFPLKSWIPAFSRKQEARLPGSIPGSPFSRCGTFFHLRCSFAERQQQHVLAHVKRDVIQDIHRFLSILPRFGSFGLGSDSSSDSHFGSHPPGLILSSPPLQGSSNPGICSKARLAHEVRVAVFCCQPPACPCDPSETKGISGFSPPDSSFKPRLTRSFGGDKWGCRPARVLFWLMPGRPSSQRHCHLGQTWPARRPRRAHRAS